MLGAGVGESHPRCDLRRKDRTMAGAVQLRGMETDQT